MKAESTARPVPVAPRRLQSRFPASQKAPGYRFVVTTTESNGLNQRLDQRERSAAVPVTLLLMASKNAAASASYPAGRRCRPS